MSAKEKFNQQLLVEGNDDLHVLSALCQKFQVKQSFEIIDCTGIGKLLMQIPIRFKQSEVEAIGIIVDADIEIKGRWDSLRSILINQGFNVPADLPVTGLILTNANNKKAGVWIMPDNNLNGMLEDFISFLVPPNDQLLPIAHTTLGDIEQQELNKYTSAHKSKAVIHSWLSWQEDPGTPMGLAITKKYLTTDGEICARLVAWLNELFNK